MQKDTPSQPGRRACRRTPGWSYPVGCRRLRVFLVALGGCLEAGLAGLALAGVSLALALHTGWLIMLTALGLRQQAVLLHPARELLQGNLK